MCVARPPQRGAQCFVSSRVAAVLNGGAHEVLPLQAQGVFEVAWESLTIDTLQGVMPGASMVQVLGMAHRAIPPGNQVTHNPGATGCRVFNFAKSSVHYLADELLDILRAWDTDLTLKYNKFYIGLAKNGQPSNFVVLRPKKDWLRLEPRLERSEEIQTRLGEAGLDLMEYDAKRGRYRIRLAKEDLKRHEVLLTELLRKAYEEARE